MDAVSTVDYHTGGEPFRIVADAGAALAGVAREHATFAGAVPERATLADSTSARSPSRSTTVAARVAEDAPRERAVPKSPLPDTAPQNPSAGTAATDATEHTVAERRVAAMAPGSPLDDLRRILCFEPRGHADMYGGFIVPPDDDGAHFGVLFWHKDGFSTACGHGTIALGVWAVETGLVAAPDTGVTDVVIDVPSGRVTARVRTEAGDVTAVDFVSVPSFVIATDVAVQTSRGEVRVDVSYGGAIYAQLDAASVGLAVEPKNIDALIALGREVKWALNDAAVAQHPGDPRLSGIYGTILFEQAPPAGAHNNHTTDAVAGAHGTGDSAGPSDAPQPRVIAQRNVTVFADGQVDRSPCGSGTAARIATLAASGAMCDSDVLQHGSIVDSTFAGSILSRTRVHGIDAVIPQVSGMAYRTGESLFTVDPRDPLTPGFVLR